MTTETQAEPLPLTARQREVLDWIRANMAYYSPTIREIAAAMSIKSPHGVTVHLEALERKGYIRMAQGKPRGIEVVNEG
jgi:repressor LexA